MMKGKGIPVYALLTALMWTPVLAVDRVPETSGFSGYVLFGPAGFDVASNLIFEGTPLLSDVGNTRIDSIFDRPSAHSAPALFLAGEVNYTFAGTRTQLFFGNRLEDFLRLDLTFGGGVRQELPDESILAFSVLQTPAEMKVWSDPYVEGVDRVATDRNKPGIRLRWGRMFGTGLEFTATFREFQHDEERSGDWLVGQGRLDPALQPLLNRNGDSTIIQFLYRIKVSDRHVFEPTVRYLNFDLEGAAMAVDGLMVRLTYLYLTPKLVLDANLFYGTQDADTVHPVYGEALDVQRTGVAIIAFYDLFKKARWRAYASVDYFREDANIAFFDSKVKALGIGAIWRYRRK